MESKRVVEITRAQCGAGAPAAFFPTGGMPVLHYHELIVIYRPERSIINVLRDAVHWMKPASVLLEPSSESESKAMSAPAFLVDLPPWHTVFFRNLSDLFRPRQDRLHLFSSAGLILAGCFRHFPSSLEPVCAVCNLSRRGRSWHCGDRCSSGHNSPRYWIVRFLIVPT